MLSLKSKLGADMKVGFLEKRVLLSVPTSGDIRTTKSELRYLSKVVKKQLILIPIGVKTDLGSIPQFLQGVFPKDGKAMFAYILHDYLYQTGMYSRKECDLILYEAMRSLGVSYWRRKAVYAGVRLGGSRAWINHRRKGDLV